MLIIGTFLLSWLAWLIFADRRRWRELFLVSLLAMTLGCFTDAFMHHYKLWSYYDSALAEPVIEITLTCGVYTVVPYLFIQWLPQPPASQRRLLYWFAWTAFTIAIEWLYLATGRINYHEWWTIAHSYAADWFIFWLLYKFHQTFRLGRLSLSEHTAPRHR